MKKERLLAIDQASKTSGWAIYENGILEKHGSFTAKEADVPTRLIEIKEKVKRLIEEEKITKVALEDIQMQNGGNNVVTFKTLAFVLGALLTLCKEMKIPCQLIGSSTWKSYCGVKGRARADQKHNARVFVQDYFGLDLPQDTVDAICIGHCASKDDRNRIDWE